MDIKIVLNDKSLKAIQKREIVIDLIRSKAVILKEISTESLNDKGIGVLLEAMEAITADVPDFADESWLHLAGSYITAESNTLKRESSRIVGNLAMRFPENVADSIPRLIQNTSNEGTVVRWGSAYALGRIVAVPQYANGKLYDTVTELYENETENGVKNQYLGGLKKARKIRR